MNPSVGADEPEPSFLGTGMDWDVSVKVVFEEEQENEAPRDHDDLYGWTAI
jgi:hypothetical protein